MIVSGFLMVGFSPVSDYIADMYGISEFWVQIQTLIFLLAFVPGNFIVIYVLDKFGLRVCVSIIELIDKYNIDDAWSWYDLGRSLVEAISIGDWFFLDSDSRYLCCRNRTSFLYQFVQQISHDLVRR